MTGHERRLGISDLRRGFAAHLARVRAGETLIITRRGVPVARLEPVRGPRRPRLVIRPAQRPFSEIAHRRYNRLNLPISSTELLRQDRDRR